MAWRKMLQQESEHQWLAITAFFVFVILGAILIKGTSHLPGVDLTDNELGNNHRIIESVYDENGDYLALTYNDGDYKPYRLMMKGQTRLLSQTPITM